MSNRKLFEVKGYSSQIADTGDYDGHWEISNGKVILMTNDLVEEDVLQPIAQALNDSECDFYFDDTNTFLMHEYEKQWQDAESRIKELDQENEKMRKALEYLQHKARSLAIPYNLYRDNDAACEMAVTINHIGSIATEALKNTTHG